MTIYYRRTEELFKKQQQKYLYSHTQDNHFDGSVSIFPEFIPV